MRPRWSPNSKNSEDQLHRVHHTKMTSSKCHQQLVTYRKQMVARCRHATSPLRQRNASLKVKRSPPHQLQVLKKDLQPRWRRESKGQGYQRSRSEVRQLPSTIQESSKMTNAYRSPKGYQWWESLTFWSVGNNSIALQSLLDSMGQGKLKESSLGGSSVKIRCRTRWSALLGCWQLNSTPVITCIIRSYWLYHSAFVSCLIIKIRKYYYYYGSHF